MWTLTWSYSLFECSSQNSIKFIAKCHSFFVNSWGEGRAVGAKGRGSCKIQKYYFQASIIRFYSIQEIQTVSQFLTFLYYKWYFLWTHNNFCWNGFMAFLVNFFRLACVKQGSESISLPKSFPLSNHLFIISVSLRGNLTDKLFNFLV